MTEGAVPDHARQRTGLRQIQGGSRRIIWEEVSVWNTILLPSSLEQETRPIECILDGKNYSFSSVPIPDILDKSKQRLHPR